jgi:signal transduction histidine kinase
LGLSIAQWIAKTHRAEISVESEAGKGSRFRVVFPALATAGVVPAEAAESHLEV